MIEVFKTNVTEASHAEKLVGLIQYFFSGHEANFDLQDCDNILRVKAKAGLVEAGDLIHFIKLHGFDAEVLT